MYVRRACELAARASGSTSPNPAVGAVVALGSTTLGEGFHRVRGGAHAEVDALDDAARRGHDVAGATLYVSLEPCDHAGLTPPCTASVIGAGIVRVVVGALDPNPRTGGGGVARLAAAGIAVDVVDDPWAYDLIEDFRCSIGRTRPYVRLKLAASLDGYVAPRPGARHWLTGSESREYVRELRATHDAVLVGANTVRIDDPELSVRPARGRRKPYVRAIAAGREPPNADSKVFAPLEGYGRTVVLVPGRAATRFAALASVADIVPVGTGAETFDLPDALEALRALGIASVLCEGGPALAAGLLEAGLVDRIDWLLAPALLSAPSALPALASRPLEAELRFERVERLGPDVLLSATIVPEEKNV